MKLSPEIVMGEWAQERDFNCGIRIIQIVKLFNYLTKIMEIDSNILILFSFIHFIFIFIIISFLLLFYFILFYYYF